MEKDQQYMLRAIKLAKRGLGLVNPNPLVGAVIVKNGEVIGEGWHEEYGGLHAERNALTNCKKSAKDATLYVTLEPCCHYGKTPPCTEAIIEQEIGRVVIGTSDPNPVVKGEGVRRLTEKGIEVEIGILEDKCRSLNKVFFHYVATGKPYAIMKYAMTIDGKISTSSGESKWITGVSARNHVHLTRKNVSAIMVGIGTVLADDPMLNCRIDNPKNPTRIICDSDLRIPIDSNIVRTADKINTYVATLSRDTMKRKSLEELGVRIIDGKKVDGGIDLNHLMEQLGAMQIDSVLIEGGAKLNYSALQSKIISNLQVYIGSKIFGGEKAKSPIGGLGISKVADALAFSKPTVTYFDNDILLEYEWGI